jgi:AraC family transcriptional regulator
MSMVLPRLLAARRFAGERDCPWHVHEGNELVLVESGRCTIACGGHELACVPGSLALLPRGLPQYQRNSGPTRTSYAVWQAGDAVLDPAPRVLQLDLASRPVRWLHDLCDLGEGPEPDAALGDALLLALLTALARLERDRVRDADLHPALAKATGLLVAGLAQPLDLGRLAAQAGVGPSHLARLFRQHHGCPPLRYQTRLRLRLAERLLQDPTLTVAEVGRRCGWTGLNYFCRVFARHAGKPPGAWRGSRQRHVAEKAPRRTL